MGVPAVMVGVKEMHVLPRGDLQIEQGEVPGGEAARVEVGVRVEQGRVVAGEGEPLPEARASLAAGRLDSGLQERLRAERPDEVAQPLASSWPQSYRCA